MASDQPYKPAIDYKALESKLKSAKSQRGLYRQIANAPFEYEVDMAFLFLGFICFFITDKPGKFIKLAGASDTEHFKMSVQGYNFNPADYKLSLKEDSDNDITKAILTGRPQSNIDWGKLSRRESDPAQARLNQANSGIAFSEVFPLEAHRGALMFCFFQYQENIGSEQREFMERYTKLVDASLA
jgi:hypothetical protein